MRLPRKFLKFDWGVQVWLGILTIIALVLSFSVLSYAAIACFSITFLMLGFWQVTSALIMTIRYKDKKRLYYLSALAVYLMLVLVPGLLFSHYYPDNMLYLSPVFAVWYAYLTYKDATYRTPSFWDLEF